MGTHRARRHARQVRRVGALAVGLGLGAAVTGVAGTAWADDDPGADTESPGGGGAGSTSLGVGAQSDSATHVDPGNGDGFSESVTVPVRPSVRRLEQDTRSRVVRLNARAERVADELQRLRDRIAKPTRSTEDTAMAERDVHAVSRADDATTAFAVKGDGQTASRSAVRLGERGRELTVRSVDQVRLKAEVPAPSVAAVPPPTPIVTVVSRLVAAVVAPFGADSGDTPVSPIPLALGALQLVRRELEQSLRDPSGETPSSVVAPRSMLTSASASATVVAPQPGDVAVTPYGDIGKWMLKSNGQIANWGGQTQGGQPILEPVNVIIIDPNSTSAAESAQKVNLALSRSGFPPSAPHSTGYRGLIDGTVYGQQPSGLLQAFADNQSPNAHGRLFGPAPLADGQGYLWSGAFSTQGTTHGYLSFTMARDEVARRLVDSGAAVRLDDADMGNAGITGDHDGKAIVLVLTGAVPNTAPTVTVAQNRPNTSTGVVTGRVTAIDAEKDKVVYAVTNTDRGTVTVTSNGSFTYTPTAAARHAAASSAATPQDRTDTFTITVTDTHGGVTAVPVTVSLQPKNSAPTAKTTVNRPDPVAGTVSGSIAVKDADGDGITYHVIDPASGSVSIDSSGSFTYTPSEAARQQARITRGTDTDRFTVTVDDGHGGLKTVTVTTTVAPSNRAPEGSVGDITAPAATNGAVRGTVMVTDPDGDTYTLSAPTRTTKGSVSISRTGAFTYTPTAAARHAAASDLADETDRTDTFVITVTDKHGATTAIPVQVEILPANAAPRQRSLSLGRADKVTGTVTGRLTATDFDRDVLRYSGPIATDKGTVYILADGSFTYRPSEAARIAAAAPNAPASAKTDTFVILVDDGHGATVPITVTVTVSPLANT